MSKNKAAVTGTLRITTLAQALNVQGTLVEQTAEFVTLDVKRRGSKKTDRTCYPADAIRVAFISEEVNETYLTIIGESVEEYPGIVRGEIAGGYFAGQMGDSAVIAAPGTWTFLPDEVEGEAAEPAAKPAKAAAKPAGKAKPEPEEEEEQEEEEEENNSEPEAYVPAKGDTVKVTDDEGDETIGEVELINATTIKVAGTKFKLADVTVAPAEAAAEGDDTPADEGDDYEPEDGDYVTITEADGDETSGTITGLTAKKVTIDDAEGESQSFMLAKVTIVKAEAPKKGGKGGAAKPAAKEDKAPAKSQTNKKAAAEDDGW